MCNGLQPCDDAIAMQQTKKGKNKYQHQMKLNEINQRGSRSISRSGAGLIQLLHDDDDDVHPSTMPFVTERTLEDSPRSVLLLLSIKEKKRDETTQVKDE